VEVVSGAIGRERVHYEAPAALRLDADMRSFLDWFNVDRDGDTVIKAAIAPRPKRRGYAPSKDSRLADNIV